MAKNNENDLTKDPGAGDAAKVTDPSDKAPPGPPAGSDAATPPAPPAEEPELVGAPVGTPAERGQLESGGVVTRGPVTE